MRLGDEIVAQLSTGIGQSLRMQSAVHRAELTARLRRRWLRAVARTGSATNLAAFRIVVTAVVLAAPEVWSAPAWAELPAAMWTAPRGMWAWLPLPVHPDLAKAALALLIGGTALGLIGFCTRPALCVS